MAKIPLITVWIAVFCVYIPMSMSLAFANPMLILAYAILAWPLGASMGRPLLAGGLTAATILVALAAMNFSAAAPEFVLPVSGVLLAALAICFTAPLAATGWTGWFIRRGWHEDSARLAVRGAFLLVAALAYLNSYLPYEWKMWIAERTTSRDLIIFSLWLSLGFVGIWRLTK